MTSTSWIVGSANWNTTYGVLETSFSTSPDSVRELISEAERMGCEAIDTAPSYVGAEEAIGVSETPLAIHTKVSSGVNPELSLRESLARLQRDRVDVLYLHDPDAAIRDGGASIDVTFGLLGEKVGAIGISIYDAVAMRAGFQRIEIGVILIPVNPLHSGLAAIAALERPMHKRIVGRSVLAQGLLAANPASLPSSVRHLAGAIESFQSRCRELKRSPVEVAVVWARDHPAIDSIILSGGSLAQLREIASSMKSAPLSPDERNLIDNLGKATGSDFDPRMWK